MGTIEFDLQNIFRHCFCVTKFFDPPLQHTNFFGISRIKVAFDKKKVICEFNSDNHL